MLLSAAKICIFQKPTTVIVERVQYWAPAWGAASEQNEGLLMITDEELTTYKQVLLLAVQAFQPD
jgi:hypothetical protein